MIQKQPVEPSVNKNQIGISVIILLNKWAYAVVKLERDRVVALQTLLVKLFVLTPRTLTNVLNMGNREDRLDFQVRAVAIVKSRVRLFVKRIPMIVIRQHNKNRKRGILSNVLVQENFGITMCAMISRCPDILIKSITPKLKSVSAQEDSGMAQNVAIGLLLNNNMNKGKLKNMPIIAGSLRINVDLEKLAYLPVRKIGAGLKVSALNTPIVVVLLKLTRMVKNGNVKVSAVSNMVVTGSELAVIVPATIQLAALRRTITKRLVAAAPIGMVQAVSPTPPLIAAQQVVRQASIGTDPPA